MGEGAGGKDHLEISCHFVFFHKATDKSLPWQRWCLWACKKSLKQSLPHPTMMLNYMQEMKADVCLAFSRWVLTPSPSDVGETTNGREIREAHAYYSGAQSAWVFNLSNGKKTQSLWGPNSQLQRRFMFWSQVLRATSRGELNKQVLWSARQTRLVPHIYGNI